MKITLNGKETDVTDRITISDLLTQMKISPQTVACELNLKIVKRSEYASIKISDGDQLEILQMIGGG